MKRCVDLVKRAWQISFCCHFSSDDSACGGFDSSKHKLGKPLPNLKPTAEVDAEVDKDAISAAAAADGIHEVDKDPIFAAAAAEVDNHAIFAAAAEVAAAVEVDTDAIFAAAAEVADAAEVAAAAEVADAAEVAAAAEVNGAERDYKRKGKMAYNWALAVTGLSVTLLVTMPHQMEASDRIIPYTCSATFACLSLITTIGLIYYSILSPVGATLAWVQLIVTHFSIVFLLCAVIFRVVAMFPF